MVIFNQTRLLLPMRIKGLDQFVQALHQASHGGLRQEYEMWLEGMGYQFLDIVQDEVIQTQTVDTRRLLNSFHKGDIIFKAVTFPSARHPATILILGWINGEMPVIDIRGIIQIRSHIQL